MEASSKKLCLTVKKIFLIVGQTDVLMKKSYSAKVPGQQACFGYVPTVFG